MSHSVSARAQSRDENASWQPTRLKFVATLHYGDSLASDEREDGEVPVFGSNGQIGTHSRANTGCPTIIVGRKGSFGKIQYATSSAFAIDTTYFINATKKSCLRWLYYHLQTLGLDTISQDTGVPGLSRELAYESVLLVPPIETQQLIADFLDKKAAAIDALIARKERLIELLQEKRQAFVAHATTKGLDPRAPMAASGIPWCPAVPEHWSLLPNKTFLQIRKTLVAGRHRDYQLLSLTKRGIVVRDVESRMGKHLVNQGANQEVCEGDLVFCFFDVEETPRTVGLSRLSGMISPDYTVLRCRDPLTAQYIELFYIAIDDRKLLRPLYTGLRKRISKSEFLSSKVPIPPREEMERIVTQVNCVTGSLSRLIDAIALQVDRLREYRQALITEAVTGRLNIPTGPV